MTNGQNSLQRRCCLILSLCDLPVGNWEFSWNILDETEFLRKWIQIRSYFYFPLFNTRNISVPNGEQVAKHSKNIDHNWCLSLNPLPILGNHLKTFTLSVITLSPCLVPEKIFNDEHSAHSISINGSLAEEASARNFPLRPFTVDRSSSRNLMINFSCSST